MESNNKRAVIYCRVSTKEQVEEGNSLASQERICREYAIKNGYEIAYVFIEQGESAKTAERTELQNLFSYCSDKKNKIQAVIAYKLDRISRNTDSYSQIRILLKRYGITIKSTSEYFENTPAGKFMENMIANVAQFDNDVRTERSVNGMKDAMREGRYVWRPPVGYKTTRINGKVNIVHTNMAPFVHQAFEELAKGLNTVYEIWTKLTSLGLQTQNGKVVTLAYFYTMLKNELYTGVINRFDERHKGIFDPIISEELFNRAQRVLKRKKRTDPYLIEHPDFPLRRFITSPGGEKLTGSWSQGRRKKYAYYRFKKSKQQWSKNYLESLFLNFVNRFRLNEHLYNYLKDSVRNKLIDKTQQNKILVEQCFEKQRLLKEKRQALVEKNLKGVISDSILQEHLEIIEDEIWKAQTFIDAKYQKAVNFGETLISLKAFLSNPGEEWKKFPFHVQLKLLWFEFPKGTSFDGLKFRTREICSVFKLKTHFLSENYTYVHKSNFHTNTPFHANSSAVDAKTKEEFWEQIGNDLRELDEIINEKPKDDLHEMQIAHFDPLKKAG